MRASIFLRVSTRPGRDDDVIATANESVQPKAQHRLPSVVAHPHRSRDQPFTAFRLG